MRIRFKLRTLLIATALVGLFLGLQVHVHNKAKRLVDEMSNPSVETLERLCRDAKLTDELHYYTLEADAVHVSLTPLSFGDVLFARRRTEARFTIVWSADGGGSITNYKHRYRLYLFGESCDSHIMKSSRFSSGLPPEYGFRR